MKIEPGIEPYSAEDVDHVDISRQFAFCVIQVVIFFRFSVRIFN
jgi:hypothetical protein